MDNDSYRQYRNLDLLSEKLHSRIYNGKELFYVFLDEIQFAISREELKRHDEPVRLYGILNGLLQLGNVDVYVTGSNSKMLSKDILTEFRGRGDLVEIYPLSFKEYYDYIGGERTLAYEEYSRFGGMPLVLAQKNEQYKARYLSSLFDELFFKDIIERNEIELPHILSELTDLLCSAVGSLTNVNKIVNTLSSVQNIQVDNSTIGDYLNYLTESFLFKCSKRYDVKGKKYFEYPSKYYCADVGLRNARLNFRQQEESHIQENIIYNELVSRGYSVDVGVMRAEEKDAEGTRHQNTLEIDFVINSGMKRHYIQSALSMDSPDKANQELRPLLLVKDSFQKIVISKTLMRPWIDDRGVLHLGIYDFLLNPKSMDI